MLFELIAVISAGFLGGGAVLIARRLLGRLPRGLGPVGAGLAMLAVAIALEYSWFGRTRDALPAGTVVALTHENRALWRPWTYVYPYVDGFIAVDTDSERTHAAVPDQRLVALYVFGRWTAPTRVRAVFDCREGRRADIGSEVTFSDDGTRISSHVDHWDSGMAFYARIPLLGWFIRRLAARMAVS